VKVAAGIALMDSTKKPIHSKNKNSVPT